MARRLRNLDKTVESFQKLVRKDRFPEMKDFARKMHPMFGSKYVCESTFSTMKQVKFENTNRMSDVTLDYSHRLATTKTGIDKGAIVSEKSWPHTSH